MLARITLPACLFLVALTARADCGDQSYLLLLSSASATTFRKTVAVLEIGSLLDSATGELTIHRYPGSTAAHKLSVEKFFAVAHMPTCRADRALEGDQFAVVEERGDSLRIVPDSRRDATAWISLSETSATYKYASIRRFDSLEKFVGVDIFFGRDDVRVYAKPSLKSKFQVLHGGPAAMSQRSAYKVLSESKGFIEIGDGGWEGEPLRSVGWVRIREHGRLAIWIAYYDDC
jgi:hypothetical protein